MSAENIVNNEVIIGNLFEDLDKEYEEVNKIVKKRKVTKSKKPNKKEKDEITKIPKYEEYDCLKNNNYKITQLKEICKYYKLKQTGNKTELRDRIYNYLKQSKDIIKLQAIWKGSLIRKWIKMHGPALKNRELCVNKEDFFLFEDVTDIHIDQFFSFKDKDNFIYGFDIVSIYNLFQNAIKKGGRNEKVLNPYNRKEIDKTILKEVSNLIKLSRTLKRDISIEIPKEEEEDEETVIKGRIINIFQNIDLLGHYTQTHWFSELNINQLKKFLRELCDIWTYRAQLSLAMKINIYPPSGDPFQNIYGGSYVGLVQLNSAINILEVQKNCLTVMERMVNSGSNNDYKNLGAYYVLTALTTVSQEAALALPWLFEAASTGGH